MTVDETNRSTRTRRRGFVVLLALIAWLAAVTLIASQHGAHRRMTFNGSVR